MADPSVTFTEERVVNAHSRQKQILACAISPDGSLIATAGDDMYVRVADAATGNVIYSTTQRHDFRDVAWYSDGNRFVTANGDGTLMEFIRSNGNWSHRTVYIQKNGLYCCAASPSGLVACAPHYKYFIVLDSNSDYSVKPIINGLAAMVRRMAFSSDGSLLAVGCDGGIVYIFRWNQSSGQFEPPIRREYLANDIRSISFSPSDFHLITGSDGGITSLWNVPSTPFNKVAWPKSPSLVVKENHLPVVDICSTGDGRHVITASCFDQHIYIWRISDGVLVGTLDAKEVVRSAAFDAQTGRLIAGLESGSLQSWLCPPYGTTAPIRPTIRPTAPVVPSFLDAHHRLSQAQKDVKKITSELESMDPSIKQTELELLRIRKEIAKLHLDIANYNNQLASLETNSMKEAITTMRDLELQLGFATGEEAICTRVIDHVTECYTGYFSSLQPGVFFDQWLFDSGISHLCGKFKELDGDRLVHMSVNDLENDGLSYINACDIHIRACVTVHMHQLGKLPDVFNWDAKQVSTWLESQGPAYASLVNLGWTGPSLLALSLTRIESSSNKAIKNEQARALKEKISALVKHDTNLPKWMRMWNGALSVVDYGEL